MLLISTAAAAAAAASNSAAGCRLRLFHSLGNEGDGSVGRAEGAVEALFERERLQLAHHLHQDVTDVHLLKALSD